MARAPNSSPQTRRVLAALLDQAADWHYGYDLGRRTGLTSGTLYPILMRLADRGWLETCWVAPTRPGRPARHTYRLTAAGATGAAALLAAPPPAPRARLRMRAPRPSRGAVGG